MCTPKHCLFIHCQYAFGYELIAIFQEQRTGVRDRASYVWTGKIRVWFWPSNLWQPEDLFFSYIQLHGDGWKYWHLWVWRWRRLNGKRTYFQRTQFPLSDQTVLDGDKIGIGLNVASIKLRETIQPLSERKNYSGVFLPGYYATKISFYFYSLALKFIDHVWVMLG